MMSTLDPNAWPHDQEPPQGDGQGVDDQAALAFEIAAMRVRASWDELDSPQLDAPPAPMSTSALDPFAPIVPAPGSQPPPALASQPPPAAFAAPGLAASAPAVSAVASAAASPSSAVDTSPMVFLQATPVAAPQQRTQTQDDLPAASFLPQSRGKKPAMIAAAVAVVLGLIGLLASGGDEAETGKTPSEPASAEAVPPRVVVPSASTPGSIVKAPEEPQDKRLAARPNVGSPTVAAMRPEASAPLAPSPRPAVERKPSEPAPESKAESSRRSKRPAAQARAQHHESASSSRTSKRKAETARPAPSQADSKRKGTGFVSTNPY